MSKIRLILWVHTFFQYSVVHAQNSENNDDINFEPVQARIPQNLLKSYEITVNFRAQFFASYYSSVYSTIGIVPALTKVEGPDGGNSSFSASIDETTPVTVFFSVPARSASIANLAKLRDLTAMEREFTRNSLVSEFILPSVLGNQPLEPQIVGDSVCPSIDCPRYQTCTEPEGQLIAIAYCESICVADYCKNDAIFLKLDNDSTWFFGAQCQYRLDDWALYLILISITFLTILALVLIIWLMCLRCRQKRDNQGTYKPRDSMVPAPSSVDVYPSVLSSASKQSCCEYNQISHENPAFTTQQRDSGISAESPVSFNFKEAQVQADIQTNSSSVYSVSTAVAHQVRTPRPGWVPSLGPAWGEIIQKKTSSPEVTPLDTSV
ncbi:Oidioi.mRNA.OKI2018_I69.XSR.g14870.t1.cds [Oikopleura dioica]|uniref:Oidioi.mRNA.OKI2018_I69.XSR.g14870.t1.cds n=1 Tax=Oikopleura dioica TaxID=34765 RepID=A0ABN7SF36_OIKDI|nr:Oidioi.mRNA.OKI2018_I69.XSR.g14870.t1.cds [Oikopleura dioica]